MIFGAENQNKNLRTASSIKVRGTEKARTANQYSAAISARKTSENSGSSKTQRTSVHQSRSKLNDGNPDPIRGSFEGLDNSKSTHIQMDNRGYDAKALQTARNSKKEASLPNIKGAAFSFTNTQNKGIMTNYTNITMAGSSSDRMNRSLDINRLF